MPKPIQQSKSSQLLSSAALTHDVTIGSGTDSRTGEQSVELLEVLLHAGSAISQVVTVKHVDAADATNYIFVLDTATLSSATDYVFRPAGKCVFKRGDKIRLTCANSGNPSITVYSKIQYRECD